MSGPDCNPCKHHQQRHGESICTKRPHDVETLEQRDIVRWLARGLTSDINLCPGFIKWT